MVPCSFTIRTASHSCPAIARMSACITARLTRGNSSDERLKYFWPAVQEFWSGFPEEELNGSSYSNGGQRQKETFVKPRSHLLTQPHDITFSACEGDFQVCILAQRSFSNEKPFWETLEISILRRRRRFTVCLRKQATVPSDILNSKCVL